MCICVLVAALVCLFVVMVSTCFTCDMLPLDTCYLWCCSDLHKRCYWNCARSGRKKLSKDNLSFLFRASVSLLQGACTFWVLGAASQVAFYVVLIYCIIFYFDLVISFYWPSCFIICMNHVLFFLPVILVHFNYFKFKDEIILLIKTAVNYTVEMCEKELRSCMTCFAAIGRIV